MCNGCTYEDALSKLRSVILISISLGCILHPIFWGYRLYLYTYATPWMLSLSLSAKYLPVSSHAPYRFHLIGLLILKESRGIRNLQHHTVVCKDSLPEPEELTLELLCQLEKCKICDIKI